MNPSGDQFELRRGAQSATVVEVGGGLRRYAVGEREVLDGYREDELARSGRGQLLAPWPNRLEDGSYEHDGESHQLPLDDVPNRCAIHGLVRWRPMEVLAQEPDAVTLGLVLHPQPGYPFALRLEVTYRLDDAGLSVHTSAENLSGRPCPFGLGHHPYLVPRTGRADDAVVCVPGDTALFMNDRSLPKQPEPVPARYDLRRPRPLGDLVLDTTYTGLARDDDSLVRVRVDDLVLWADTAYDFLQLFTGDPLPDVARRSIAVEPMTCAPNAFRTGAGLRVLVPGEIFEARWGLEVERGEVG